MCIRDSQDPLQRDVRPFVANRTAQGDFAITPLPIPAEDALGGKPEGTSVLALSLIHIYLREVRKIDLAVASGYLRHIHYEVGGREYSAIGFPNRSGGYELRDDNAFKGTIAPKDISDVYKRQPLRLMQYICCGNKNLAIYKYASNPSAKIRNCCSSED